MSFLTCEFPGSNERSMNQTTGHLLRFAGLLLEMLGIWGVYYSYRKIDQPAVAIPGGTIVPWPWAVWAIGFVVWLIGRIIVSASRKPRRCRSEADVA
jgi:hypothetical protein